MNVFVINKISATCIAEKKHKYSFPILQYFDKTYCAQFHLSLSQGWLDKTNFALR